MNHNQTSAATGYQRQPASCPPSSLSPLPAPIPPPAAGPQHASYPLYDPRFEHDACGMGFVANISGQREHRIVEHALEALANLAHRGAMDADAETSDGVGVMTQIPYRFLAAWLAEQGLPPVAYEDLAVGMFFLPQTSEAAERTRELLREALGRRGAEVLAWRVVPVEKRVLGAAAQPGSIPTSSSALCTSSAKKSSLVWLQKT
jgi:glutamate synthase domain-containing protein 1